MGTRRDWYIAGAAIALVAGAALTWVAPWQGDQAPDVRIETLGGDRFELKDFRGQPVIVTFWATSCVTCVEEIPYFKALHDDLHEAGLEIVAVAMEYDPESQVRAMTEERELPYRVALDRDGSVARAFGDIRLTPTTYLVGPEGEIRQKRLGMVDPERLRERILPLLPEPDLARAE